MNLWHAVRALSFPITYFFSRYFGMRVLYCYLSFLLRVKTLAVLKLVISFLFTAVLLAYDELQNYLPTLSE